MIVAQNKALVSAPVSVGCRFNDYFLFQKNSIWVVFAVSLYCLHMLRYLVPAYVILPPLLSLAGVIFALTKSTRLNAFGVLNVGFFVFASILPLVYSYLWYPDEEYLIPIMRYLYLAPFFLFAIRSINNQRLLFIALKTIVFFVFLGALTIFYQMAVGPLAWLAEPSEREGLVRFSSLLGSLTAYGVYGGLVLPLAFFLLPKGIVRWAVVGVIIVGLLVTLQKAAVVNVFLFIALAFCIGTRATKVRIVFVVAVGLLALAVAYVIDVSYVVATVDNVLRLRNQSGVSDVSLPQSIIDRIWILPSRLYELHGFWGMLLGVGMVGGSGTLGFPDYPMSHNGFFDLLYIGGVLNLSSFLALAFYLLYRLRLFMRMAKDSDSVALSQASFCIFVLFIANFIFAGVLYFQPYGGLIFYLLVSFYFFHFRP